ncbi:MAG: S9 family peptidase, partial [Candidatus Kapaibacterium sp.]
NDVPLKPFGGVKEIAWAPDSKQIAYTSKKVQDPEMSTNSDIYLVNLENGKPTGRHINITQGMEGFDKQPQYSPDGKYIAFHSQERAGFESDRIRLMLHDRKTFDNFDLTSTFDNWVSEKIWAPDSKTIYFTAGTKGTVQIFKMSVPDGKWDVVTDGWYNYGQGMDITPDGTELIFGRQSMVHALDIWKMKLADGVISRLTDINQQIYKDLKLPEIKEKWITSTDGAKVHCWVIYPPDFHESNEYPMITYCQGGPQAMIGQRFHFRWNWYLMASKGYVVLCPNRRGVPGFGQEWNDAISMDWGGLPMDDIMAATDAMTIEKYIDRERVAAIGASAGGYAAFWLAGNHEGRYAAFLAHCGVFNLESMYGSTEELWFPNWEYGGPYWEDRKNYEQNSPHRFARNWDTPIVISTGERDYRVPYTQSLEAFTVAQVKGIDSKLLVYPEETHFIASPQEYIIWDNEVFDFLDKYCK